MRALATVLLLLASVPGGASAQDDRARDLASPWSPGSAPPGAEAGPPAAGSETETLEAAPPDDVEPQDIHAEGSSPTVGPGGVVVPDGYSPAIVPSPGIYPGVGPRIVTDDTLELPSGIVTRIRALDSDLTYLAARGGGSILDGILALIPGAISIAIGVVLDVTHDPGARLSPYLYTYGSGMIVRGILHLALMTNPGASATTYAHMPMRTHREVRDRLRYGENELRNLAEMSSISRYVDGSLNVAVGLLIVPVYVAPNGFDVENPFTWLMLVGAGLSVTTGLISIFTTSDAERRWSAYDQLRDRLAASADGGDDDAELDALADEDPMALLPPPGPAITGRAGLGGFSLEATF